MPGGQIRDSRIQGTDQIRNPFGWPSLEGNSQKLA